MATLTIFPSKPPDYIIYKPSSKHLAPQPSSVKKKNARFDFTDVPIEKLQAPRGATSGSDLRQKLAGDSKAIVEDTQASGDDLVGTRGMCSDYVLPRRPSLSDVI